jgi:hypothetical protein
MPRKWDLWSVVLAIVTVAVLTFLVYVAFIREPPPDAFNGAAGFFFHLHTGVQLVL